jgi:hypothetical protein
LTVDGRCRRGVAKEIKKRDLVAEDAVCGVGVGVDEVEVEVEVEV